jgi:membrane associated rhomboid family serine protease
MSKGDPFRYTYAVVWVPMLAVLLIWTVFWIEVDFGINFNDWGVYPRTLTGLRGILASPFIHGSIEHLYNNTIPIAVLTSALFYFYRRIAWRVLLVGLLLSGLITWIIARPSYHIGASGMIYVLASFIFFKGIFSRHMRLVAISLIVVFIYGSLIWYIFPIKDGISWEGHLGGFLSGLFLAFVLRSYAPEKRKYAWENEDYKEEDDPFLRHFDEEGNFIDDPDGDRQDEKPSTRIVYHIRKKEKDPPTE